MRLSEDQRENRHEILYSDSLIGNAKKLERNEGKEKIAKRFFWLFLMFIDPITVIDQSDQSDQSIPNSAVSWPADRPDRTDQSADQWGHLARGGGQLANEGSVPSRAPISTIDQVIDHGPGVAKLFFLHPIFLIILLHPSISSSSHLLLLSSVSSSIPPLPPFLSPHRLLLLLVYTSVFFLLCTHFLFPLHLFHFLLDVIKNLILLHLLHLIRFSPNPPSAVIKLVFLRRLLFFTQ